MTDMHLSVDLSRGTRRFQRFVTLGGSKPSGQPPQPRGVFDPSLLRAAIPHAFRKLDPRLLIRNPVMFVVEITAVLVTLIAIGSATGLARPRAASVSRSRSPPGSGSRSSSRPTPRPWPRHAGVPRPPPCVGPDRRRRPPPPTRRHARGRRLVRAAQGRRHRRQRAGGHPRRRRRHRGRGLRQRVGHHRGVGTRAQGARDRHPQLRDRRHHPGQRPARGVGHGRSRRDLPGPHDRARRGRQATADAQRDRPGHPPGGPDHRLPDGHRHAAALRPLRRCRGQHGGPHGPPRLPHPDDHRRPALGHRHRRHGPRGALQRAGHERSRRRGLRRRRRHPPRQDGHHHLRQPPGRLDHAGARCQRDRGPDSGPGGLDPGRDARGSLDRRLRPRPAGRARRARRQRR